MSAVGSQPFNVVSVINQSFGVTRRNLGGFVLITLLVIIAAMIVGAILGSIFFGSAMMAGMGGGLGTGEMSPAGMMSLGFTAVIGSILMLVLVMAIQQLGVAAITYGAVQDLRSRTVSVGECLSRGLGLMFPVLGVALLCTLLTAAVPMLVGYILEMVSPTLARVVNFILQAAAWLILYVAIPVAVIEQPGAVASLKRSVHLTEGYRFCILWMGFLIGLIGLAVGAVIALLFYLLFTISSALASIIAVLAGIAITLLFVSYAATLPAVTYYNLRVAKEGTDIVEIGKVFD